MALEILDELEKDAYVSAIFSAPVDTTRFVDNWSMIEVPIDLSMVRKRIQKNYYTNVNSLLADIELIHDNCAKYNKDESPLTSKAQKLYDSFKDLLFERLNLTGLDPAERSLYEEIIEQTLPPSLGRRSSRQLSSQTASSLKNIDQAGNRPSNISIVRGTNAVAPQAELRGSQRVARRNQNSSRSLTVRISLRKSTQQQHQEDDGEDLVAIQPQSNDVGDSEEK